MARYTIDEKYSLCFTDDQNRVLDLVVNDNLVRSFPRLDGDYVTHEGLSEGVFVTGSYDTTNIFFVSLGQTEVSVANLYYQSMHNVA